MEICNATVVHELGLGNYEWQFITWVTAELTMILPKTKGWQLSNDREPVVVALT